MNMQQLETYFPYPTSSSTFPGKMSNSLSNMWLEDTFVKSMGMSDGRALGADAADTTFAMLDEMVKHALQDAAQSCDLGLRWEAVAWLWVCCPDIADQLLLNWSEEMPERIDLQQKAAAYLARYPE